jgi:hypothetical protein
VIEENVQCHGYVPEGVMREFDKIVRAKYGGRYGGFSTELTNALLKHISEYKKGIRVGLHTHTNSQNQKEQEILRIKGRMINYLQDKYGYETTHVLDTYLKDAIRYAIDKKDSRTVNNWYKYFIAKGLFSEDGQKIKIIKIQSAFSGEEIAPLQGDLR